MHCVGKHCSPTCVRHLIYWKQYERNLNNFFHIITNGIKILGVTFVPDDLRTTNYNWGKRVEELKVFVERNKTRKLSLRGKILLLRVAKGMAKVVDALGHPEIYNLLSPSVCMNIHACMHACMYV